ncbi:unnamed protein product [Paramecium pentaurelia]|uniref:Transmembrane protein n=1 Tax=Paramecium pentaurelia TaxID=43138 RepID=A0A8S1UMI3_9CILI|nr:unnamed protein product [Paramecium pentaurelia]
MLISFKNRFNEKLEDLNYSYCQVKTAIFYENNRSVSQEKIIYNLQLDQNNKAFDLSSLSFSFDPYNQDQQLLQIGLNCYFEQSYQKLQYLIYAKTLKCQLGEFYIDKGCQICQSNQGFYSVTYNTTKCSIFDKQKFENISSNQIKLLSGYWRPNYLSDYTEYCFKNPTFCIGGWDVGHNLCSLGHIGGLCEECDIFDQRGKGQFYKNLSDFQCQECNKIWKSMLSFIFTSIWSFLSILITLRSIDKSNKLFSPLKIGQKYSKIIFKLNQDHESILIKMLLNYLWIFSVIFNFNFRFSISFNFIEQTSNKFFVMIHNLDYYLSQIQNIELIYLRLIFIRIYHLGKVQKIILNRGFISNTLLSLYVSNYTALIKQFCSIISNRQISQISYIQGDVSLLQGTPNHISWIICLQYQAYEFFVSLSLSHYLLLCTQIENNWIKQNSEDIFAIYIMNIKLLLGISNIFFQSITSRIVFTGILNGSSKTKTLYYFKFEFLRCLNRVILFQYYIPCWSKIMYVSRKITQIYHWFFKFVQRFFVSDYVTPLNILQVYFKKYKVLCVEVMYKISRFLKADCFLTVYLINQLKKLNQREQRLRNNFTKICCHLMSMSKAQIGQTIRYRQTIIDVEMNKLINT